MRPDAAKQGTRAPATMTAVWHDRYGPPEVLATVSGVEVPTPGADQVLVRVHTAGVSRGVTHLTSGLPRLVRLASGVRKPRQAVPGMDVCGTIVGVGSQVTGLAVDQRVLGIAQGSFAEYAVADSHKVVPAPDSLSDAECAVLAESGLTAVQALRKGGLRAGSGEVGKARILILGASGGVGSFAVKLASRWGATVSAVCSARKAPEVRKWGATRVFDYRVDLRKALDTTYDMILDIAGGTPLTQMRKALSDRGSLIFVGNENGGTWTGGYERPFAYQLRMMWREQRFVNLLVQTSQQDLELLAAEARRGLRPHVHAVHPLSAVHAALGELIAGRITGKTALAINETE